MADMTFSFKVAASFGLFFFIRAILMVSQKVTKALTQANAWARKRLIFLDFRLRANNKNGCFPTFYEFVNFV
jgi:hypothetical protein